MLRLKLIQNDLAHEGARKPEGRGRETAFRIAAFPI
jgi:hypothetical protein